LEESVVDDVSFAVLPLHNPLAFRHVAETNIGGNRFGLFALRGINDQRSKGAECTHGSSIGAWPMFLLKDFIHKECDGELLGIRKG
jgi:hypothetical protein